MKNKSLQQEKNLLFIVHAAELKKCKKIESAAAILF
jgi:hypothetical protein